MLVLNQSQVRLILTMQLAFDGVSRGCVEYSAGKATIPQRAHIRLTKFSGDTLFMPGHLAESGAYGIKVVSNFARNPDRGLPIGPGLLILLDQETGIPLALMDASYLTDLRTGVLSGLACRYLARPDSRIAAIIGSGAQARTQLLGIAHVLSLSRAYVFSRRQENVEAFIRDMGPQLPGVELVATRDPNGAVSAADIVVAATTSDQPVVFGEWLRPGTCVCGVGSNRPEVRELDGEVVRRGRVFAVDSRLGALKGAGDFGIPIAEGILQPEDVAELGELILGLRPGRRSVDEIAVFKSVGFAAADLTTATEIYHRARERGLGTEVQILV